MKLIKQTTNQIDITIVKLILGASLYSILNQGVAMADRVSDNNKLNSELKSDTEFVGIDCQLGNDTYNKGNFKASVGHLSECIEKHPKVHYAYYIRAQVYRNLAENADTDSKQKSMYKKEIEDLSRLIKLGYKTVEIYEERGRAYKDIKNYRKATDDLGEAYFYKADPFSPEHQRVKEKFEEVLRLRDREIFGCGYNSFRNRY